MQGGEAAKRKTIGLDCIVFAQMRMEDDGINAEVGIGKLANDAFEREFGGAYTEALDRTVKQLRDTLQGFADELDRIGMKKASADAGTSEADA